MRDRALWLLVPTSPPLVLRIVVVVAVMSFVAVVASVQALLRAARDRAGMRSALAR
jgi:hypothetical protein